MRSAAVSLWLSAVQVAAALIVGNLLAKRLLILVYQTAMSLNW